MESSSLSFITCDELRKEFAKCPDELNKRILIIDVRDSKLYERCHLCLDSRNNIGCIKTKMRVMNINPNLLKVCTAKNIMTILNPDDLKVFNNRKDATDVIIIEAETDDYGKLSDPKSKVMRLINGLTRFDNQPDEKITVPINILQGGYTEWHMKYQHFTTDPSCNLDSRYEDTPILSVKPASTITPANHINPKTTIDRKPLTEQNHLQINNITATPLMPKTLSPSNSETPQLIKSVPTKPALIKPLVTKVVPSPPIPITPKPNVIKNAPGTAVQVNLDNQFKCLLSRSHSSPNVAQPEGDTPNENSEVDYQIGSFKEIGRENHHISPPAPSISKPRFDRKLKPPLNNESIIQIKSQLNFGRSPEASGRAITGLQNLGNTCFMNSVVQCLAYAPSLVSYFCSDSYYNHLNLNSQYGSGGELAIEFGALIERLNAHRHRYIEPKSFRDAVTKHIGFAGNEQQDSHEFMMMLFDKLHHDLNIHAKEKFRQNGIVSQNGASNNDDSNINVSRATLGYQFWNKYLGMNKSIISELFEGIFMSTLTCTYCKGQSNTFEVFNCLSLPIPSETRCHLRDCLNHFSSPERIEAAWECPRCKEKREADKKIVICRLPKILIIHLKRFSLDGRWRQKLQTTVDFPLTDLNVDCTNVLPQSAYGLNQPKTSYNLYAVVNHYGHLDGGHYTAFCKLESQRWCTFDDSNVSEMRDAEVCGQAAYILFYMSTSY